MSITIGSATSYSKAELDERMRLLLWGAPGCGKTVLGYTAPKPIFSIQWDTAGATSLYKEDGIEILDLSGEAPDIVDKFKMSNTKEYKMIEEHVRDTNVASILCDSCTTFANKAIQYVTDNGSKFSRGNEQVSPETPGLSGYGVKNVLVNRMIMGLLGVAVRTKTHLVVIAHEDLPDKDTKGNILQQTIMLGSSLAFQIPVDFGEVWHMSDNGGKRYISIRPKGYLKPMKTRMFDNRVSMGFYWNYDQIKKTGTTITSLYEEWRSNGFNKIAPPRS